MSLTLNVDGGARGNPGPAGAGVVLAHEDGTPVFEAAYWLGTQTNNTAEYQALIRGLQVYLDGFEGPLAIRSDSELVVKQITGAYRVKNPGLVPLFEQVQMLLLKVAVWKIQHVRREHNKRADELANMAMDSRTDMVVTGEAAVVADAPDATPPVDDAPVAAENAAVTETGPRCVRISATRAPNRKVCPAADWCASATLVGPTLPAGICVYAAQALAPTLVAAQNTAPGEFATIPTLTLRCNQSGCEASFQVAPESGANGSGAS